MLKIQIFQLHFFLNISKKYEKPNSEKQSQDLRAQLQELSRDFAQQVVTARIVENVAESERKADLGEEATEMGKETSYASQV